MVTGACPGALARDDCRGVPRPTSVILSAAKNLAVRPSGKTKDQGEILKWEYEPETFWFEKIKRGVRTYTPDFKVTEKDGSIIFHEVKGYMDARSKTKLKRMKKTQVRKNQKNLKQI